MVKVVFEYRDEWSRWEWRRQECVTSTLFGEVTDAAVFNLGMWLGILPIEMIMTTIITYGLGKVLYEIIVYPLTRIVIRKVKTLED